MLDDLTFNLEKVIGIQIIEELSQNAEKEKVSECMGEHFYDLIQVTIEDLKESQ